MRIPSSRSSATTNDPSSMPRRRRSFAGSTIVPRRPTLLANASTIYRIAERANIKQKECQAKMVGQGTSADSFILYTERHPHLALWPSDQLQELSCFFRRFGENSMRFSI